MSETAGSTNPGSSRGGIQVVSGTRRWAWVLLAIFGLILAVVAFAPDSLLPPYHHAAPDATVPPPWRPPPDQYRPIRGPKTLTYGGLFMISGKGTSNSGSVTVVGSWNNQPWRSLGSAAAQGELFHFIINVNHHGVLRLQITRTDGVVFEGTYRVVTGTSGNTMTSQGAI